jgi:hypothetical protein
MPVYVILAFIFHSGKFMYKKVDVKKSTIMSNFIAWIYRKDNANRALHDYDFLISEFQLATQMFLLKPSQFIALYFQFAVQLPFDSKKATNMSCTMLRSFMKKLNKNCLEKTEKTAPVITLPAYSFDKIHINRAINIMREIAQDEFKEHFSTDAKAIWDLNHFYYSLDYEIFFEFLNMEFKDYENKIDLSEFFIFKVHQFEKILNNSTIFKTSRAIYMFENQAQSNLKKFIAEYNVVEKPHYH